MTDRSRLSDTDWSRIQSLLSTTKGIRLTSTLGCRRFVDAVLWILRSGAQWRMLPRCFGSWNSVFKRFACWCRLGVWGRLHSVLTRNADLQHVCIDSSIVRAHACAAGAANSTAAEEALGSSRGGSFSWTHEKSRKHVSDHAPVYIALGNARLHTSTVTAPDQGKAVVAPAQAKPQQVDDKADTTGVGAVRGNSDSRIYHRPDCPSYGRISAKHVVEFESAAVAEAAGYRLAGNCH